MGRKVGAAAGLSALIPSGHVGAATAQALAVGMLAADLPPRPRRLVRAA